MAAMTKIDTGSIFQPDNDEGTSSPGGFGLILGALKKAQTPPPDKRLEFLFEDEYAPTGPSWGARICYGAGMTYLSGLAVGGSWGLLDGLRNPAGRTTRLRLNCILNSMTARGPFVANNLGILALLYNLVHGGVVKAREGRYDLASEVGSAVTAGVIYKSTKGVKQAGVAGLLFGTGMLGYQLAKRYYEERSILHM
ncbi:Tim17 domain-containing protein [Paramicrosporidium saccamoebae]|uniref:Tim17 domain-containing protein n=1 Tax=Paramicrosporidium saccamoebae TaxID=1246581 RepID=A0A2H9TNX1_9FUNG|nr:Tim17 domain-containing protein [Paramicrosporidium saccamoebae]